MKLQSTMKHLCQLQSTMEHDVVQAGDYVDKIMGDFTMVLQELSELHRLKS